MQVIKPIVLGIKENSDLLEEAMAHFEEQGIHDILVVTGINAETFNVTSSKPYFRDDINSTYIQPNRKTGCTLSHYLMYCVMFSHPEFDYWFFLEDDCRFVDGWREKFEQALKDVPQDFDMLFTGSCCTEGREKTHIKGDVYELKYPLCTHSVVIHKRVLPLLIEKCTDASQPIDVLLFDRVFPEIKVYTVLPRLANQTIDLPI